MSATQKAVPAGSYWNRDGRHQELQDHLFRVLVPESGTASTAHGELLRAFAAIYYDLYNNGGCNLDLPHFQDHQRTLREAETAIVDKMGGREDWTKVMSVVEAMATTRPPELCGECGAELEPIETTVSFNGVMRELERVADAVVLVVAEMEDARSERVGGMLEMMRAHAGVPTVDHLLQRLDAGSMPGICTVESCEELQPVRTTGPRAPCRECGAMSVASCAELVRMLGPVAEREDR